MNSTRHHRPDEGNLGKNKPLRFHKRHLLALCLSARTFFLGLLFLHVGVTNICAASFTNILKIDFEPGQGYTQHLVLHGQGLGRWRSNETNYSSSVEQLWPTLGPQAYVGLTAPTFGKDIVQERSPITLPNPFDPVAQQVPCVSFSALFRIEPSTQGANDDFGWSFATSQQEFLFAVGFDNASKLIYYETNGSDFQYSIGTKFTNSVLYRLQVDMNFTNNLWSASLNGMAITPGPIPIAAPNKRFNFGYFYANWYLADLFLPGNNFMSFDHIGIVAGPTPPLPAQPTIQINRSGGADAVVTLSTEPGLFHFLETSDDFRNWQPFRSAFASNFVWSVNDASVTTNRQRFYRGRVAAGP